MTSGLKSLANRNYRLFLGGQLVSIIGNWFQRIAQDWLVLELTNGSPTAVGTTSALQFLPMLVFGLWGGLLADRLPKRRVLILTQSTMAFLALGLSALIFGHVVSVWQVYAFAFVSGVVSALDKPVRQSFVIELVGRRGLAGAVGLNSATFNIGRLVGPAIGGLTLSAVGPGYSFLINATSFLAVLSALTCMRESELYTEPVLARAPGQVRDGLRYLRRHRTVLLPIFVVFMVSSISINWPVMLAVLSRNDLHTGAAGYGTLYTALSVGSIAGALLTAHRAMPRFRYVVGSSVLFGLLELLVGCMPSYGAVLVVLVPVGFCALTLTTTSNSLVQVAVPYELRGRIMAIYLLASGGGTTLGAPLQGWVAAQFGPRATFFVGGAVAVASGLLAFSLSRGSLGGVRRDWRVATPETQVISNPSEQM